MFHLIVITDKSRITFIWYKSHYDTNTIIRPNWSMIIDWVTRSIQSNT